MLEVGEAARLLAVALGNFIAHGNAHHQTVVDAWKRLAYDQNTAQRIAVGDWPFLTPLWRGVLATEVLVENSCHSYQLCATDGSSLEPDRHQGIPISLVNIGSVCFSYGDHSTVQLASRPFLFSAVPDEHNLEQVVELLHLESKRTELELEHGFELTAALQPGEVGERVYLFDGSLIFWHLEPERFPAGREFLERYIGILERFYAARIPTIGYISLPKSRELVNVLRALGNLSASELLGWVDADLMALFLPVWHRSCIFENRTAIVARYPYALRPYFFYLNVGAEIARIELPAWVIHEGGEALVAKLVAIIGDQCVKGGGYPIALAEAHEQAVVKSGDRAVFFECMRREMERLGRPFISSRKSQLKKRLHV